MNKYTIIFELVLISNISLRANITYPDSLVIYDNITFNTEFEKQVLNKYITSGIPEYFELFLSTSEDIDSTKAEKYSKTFNSFYENLNSKKFLKYNNKKKIKTIYRSVHKHFFYKYELLTTFENIFKNGEYNCVTASALFGIILYKLNIPFFIVETPIHVYIVSYPDEESIKIETSGPYAGYFIYSQSIKRDFIEYYKEYKLIDEEEYTNTSIDDLFDKYYFSGNKISLEELIGIYYINISAYNFLKNKADKGFSYLEKAYIFYPVEATRILFFNYLNYMIDIQDYDKIQDLNYLIKLTKFKYHPSVKKKFISEFVKITENNLIDTSNTDYYDSIYNYLSERITNDEYLKEIAFIYNYEKGRHLINSGNKSEGHNFFIKALKLEPNNENVQIAFIHSLKEMLVQLEIIAAIEKLETYTARFRELTSNNEFIKLKMTYYLKAALSQFKSNNIASGDELLEKFENLAKSNTQILPDDYLIGETYSAASVYYFKKSLYNKAREYLTKGLNYAPENKSLRIGISSF